MDTQEAANLAQIENTRLSRKLVYIGYATLAVCALGTIFAAWAVLRSRDTSQASPTGGGFMLIKWLPVIILGSCSLTLAAALFVISFRRWKYSKRESDYKLARTQINTLKDERAEANSNNVKVNKELERQISLKEDQYQSFLNSRRELSEFKAEADAQTRIYDVTFEGMKKELKEFEHQLSEANKIINRERGQSEQFDQMYRDEKARHEKILWVLDIIGKHAQHLNRYVVIDLISIVRVHLDDSSSGGPRIRCGFRIRNNSIFTEIIVHRDQVKGSISFRGRDLTEKVKLDWHNTASPMVDKLANEQYGWVHLEQDLTSAEIDRLERALKAPDSDNAIVGFEEIVIDVSGGARFPDVKKHSLVIPEEFRRVLLRDCKICRNTDNA